MIVADFDIERVPLSPSQADPPLIIDADRMLSFTFPLERFKPIARRHTQIRKDVSCVDRHQLPPGTLGYVWREASNIRCSEKLLCQFVFEISYHDFTQTDRGGLCANELQLLPRRLQPCKVIAGMV